MREHSPRITQALKERRCRLVGVEWDGNLGALLAEPPCLVHFTRRYHQPIAGLFIEACNRYGHLGFCSDEIINGDERDPGCAVNLWLDQNFGKTIEKALAD